jgi:hypothetical protein
MSQSYSTALGAETDGINQITQALFKNIVNVDDKTISSELICSIEDMTE